MSIFRTSVFRAAIIAVVCAQLLLLSGCSALRIGYGTAPDLVYWWLDGYIDFNGSQTARVHQAIAQWFAWHRRTQLPDYAAQLELARSEVLADTTPARVCEWQAALVERARTAFDQIVPAASDIMLTITAQQIQHLDRRYAKFNQEFRDDYLQPDPRKRAEEALKRTVDRAEMLYGRLDDAQRENIAQTLASSPFDAEVWLAERRQRQQDVLQMLRTMSSGGANREQAPTALRVYEQRMEHSPREAYRVYAERLSQFNCAFAAAVHNATTLAQRHAAAERLAGWESDLRAIAASTDKQRTPGVMQ
jgi:hypothetical protein